MTIPGLYQKFTYLVIAAGHVKIDWDAVEVVRIEEIGEESITIFQLRTDQAGLIGFLRALYNKGVPLISVNIRSLRKLKGVSSD